MKTLILVLIGAMIAIGCQKTEAIRELPGEKGSATIPTAKPKLPSEEPNVLLVGLKDNTAKTRTLGRYLIQKSYHTVAMKRSGDPGFHKIRTENKSADIARLKADPNVAWVSPNYSVQTQETPTDPYYNSTDLWGLYSINAAAAWNKGNHGSQQVIVGVVDEPPFICHEDLKDQFWKNPYEVADNKIDDDGNGYIDDIQGWNFVLNTPNIYMGASLTHGTHVSGTVGARGFNNKGVVGVSPNITMIAAPFLGAGGGFIDNAILAFDYLTGLKTLHPELKISHSTNSWGGGGYSQGFVDCLNRAKAKDIGTVFAAGNNNTNNDNIPFYPASYKSVMGDYLASVLASQWDNNKASFSCFGKTTVDIGAPGTGIISTVQTSSHTSGYGSKSGTSMATPHVAGAIALLRIANPEWTFDQCLQALKATATKVPGLTDYCISGGIINLNSEIFRATTPAIQATRE
jgi:subtilisin family serine protease